MHCRILMTLNFKTLEGFMALNYCFCAPGPSIIHDANLSSSVAGEEEDDKPLIP